MEHASLRSRGPGLVPRLPYLHELREGGFLPRHVAASCPPRRVQAQGSALPRHPRGRRARRGAVGEVDPAGGGSARLGPVAPPGIFASAWSLSFTFASGRRGGRPWAPAAGG